MILAGVEAIEVTVTGDRFRVVALDAAHDPIPDAEVYYLALAPESDTLKVIIQGKPFT